MSLTNTGCKYQYTGNGVTTSFATTFEFLENSDVSVLVVAPGATTPATLNQGTDYTISGAGVSTGGTVVCAVAPVSGAQITILRTTPLTQVTTFEPNDSLPASALENGLDKLTMIDQEMNGQGGQLARAIQFPVTEPVTTNNQLPIAAARANGILAFDANGNVLIAEGLGQPRGQYVAGTAYNAHDIITDSSQNVYQAAESYTAVSVAADVAAGNLVLILNAVAIAQGISGSVTPIAAWATAIAYAVGNIVYYTNNDIYRCATAHTSGVFATDLAAGKWVQLAPASPPATYGTDTGSANAYVVNASPAPTSLVAGEQAQFLPAHTNTGASTLNFCGFGVKNIYKLGATGLIGGDLTAGNMVTLQYDGTNWQLLNFPGLLPQNNLSDLQNETNARENLGLGTAATQNVGTGAGNVVQLDGSARLPAVDGSQLTNLSTGGLVTVVALTSSGTWTVPAGVTSAKVTVIGGGGGGSGTGTSSGNAGTAGSASSIGGISASGGAGGVWNSVASWPCAPGVGSGGIVNAAGGISPLPIAGQPTYGALGAFGYGNPGKAAASGNAASASTGFGAGGASGSAPSGATGVGLGGGGGGGCIGFLTGLTPGNVMSYTIGAGGAGGAGASGGGGGGAGAPGVIIIEY